MLESIRLIGNVGGAYRNGQYWKKVSIPKYWYFKNFDSEPSSESNEKVLLKNVDKKRY